MSAADATSVLLIRAVDAGGTYLSFRWLDDAANPVVHVITTLKLNRVLARLDTALVGGGGADGEESVRRALTGPFTRYFSEFTISEALSRVILPDAVTAALVERARGGRVVVRITPSRSLARVPFELLVVAGDTRLIELAELCYEPPAALHLGRARDPEVWTESVADRPVLYVVDPVLPAGSGRDQTLVSASAARRPSPGVVAFRERIGMRSHTHRSGVGRPCDRWDLSEELCEAPSRLFYFGHVSSTVDQPGSASIHLTDDAQQWGLAESVNGSHRPLAALDFLLGTARPDLGDGEASHIAAGVPGHRLWPMPPRVTIIACEGGVDYRSSETFGLVVAMFSAGAEVLTTTRWTLPSDTAFTVLAGAARDRPGPTTELALAVDETHMDADPVAALAVWQRAKLEQWRASPGAESSPLTWASVGTHVCARREVTGVTVGESE